MARMAFSLPGAYRGAPLTLPPMTSWRHSGPWWLLTCLGPRGTGQGRGWEKRSEESPRIGDGWEDKAVGVAQPPAFLQLPLRLDLELSVPLPRQPGNSPGQQEDTWGHQCTLGQTPHLPMAQGGGEQGGCALARQQPLGDKGRGCPPGVPTRNAQRAPGGPGQQRPSQSQVAQSQPCFHPERKPRGGWRGTGQRGRPRAAE